MTELAIPVAPDGYLHLNPEDTEEYKKTHQFTNIDGVDSFPFIYLKVSSMERIYIKIKNNEHIVLKNGLKTLVRNRKKNSK